MKIAIDARFWGPENTGPGRYTMSLIRSLERLDQSNEYYLLLRKKYFDAKDVTFKDNFHKVLADVAHYSLKEQILLPRIIKKIDPDLTHYLHFNVPAQKEKRRIVTIHDLLMHKRTGAQATTLPWYLYAIKRIGYKFVFHRAVSSADTIIVPSNFVRDEIARYYNIPKDRIITTYEGVEDSVVKHKAQKQRSDKYFLYIGNAYPHKNLPRVIEAIKCLNEQNSVDRIVKLVVVSGRGVFQERIKSWVYELGATKYVDILDFVTDGELSALYRNSCAFVFPSVEEGFGLPGIEAMANSTLLCASDIKVFREVYGKNAMYFNPYDFSSITQTMKDALEMNSKYKSERIKAAKIYAKRYTWDNTAKATLNIYEDCFSLRSGK